MTKVITYGTYDMLHQGHINLLKRAETWAITLSLVSLLKILTRLAERSTSASHLWSAWRP